MDIAHASPRLRGRRLGRAAGFVVGVATALVLIAAPARAQASPDRELQFFRIGTGPTTGIYFPVGALIASVVSNPPGSRPCERGGSCGVPNLIAVAQATQDSVARLRDIAGRRIDSGLVQADVAYLAYQGKGPFARQKLGNLRAIARLYPEYLHVVVRADSAIRSFSGLKGKRVGLDLDGSGTRVMAQAVMPQLGIRLNEFTAQSVAVSVAADMIRARRLDAFAFSSGIPAEAVQRLADETSIALLPISPAVAARVAKSTRGLFPAAFAAGVYKGVPATPTVITEALWLVPAETNADLVYGLTRALWNPNNRRLLDSGHPQGRAMRVEQALDGLTIPLHPGAERYYREIGYAIPPSAEPSPRAASQPSGGKPGR